MKTIYLTKILPKNSTKLYAVVSLFFGILIFLIFFFLLKNVFISSIIAFGIASFAFITCALGEIFGKKRHYTIIESKGFQELIVAGFKTEEVNEYKGLSGEYNSYLFDIYYDWSAYVKPKLDKAVIFNVYFIPPTLSSGKTDHIKLKALSQKYNVSNWSFKSYNFWWREGNMIMKNGVGIFNPSYKKLIEKMDIALDILRKENLKPLDRQTLNNWRKEFPMSNIPEIELYYKE